MNIERPARDLQDCFCRGQMETHREDRREAGSAGFPSGFDPGSDDTFGPKGFSSGGQSSDPTL